MNRFIKCDTRRHQSRDVGAIQLGGIHSFLGSSIRRGANKDCRPSPRPEVTAFRTPTVPPSSLVHELTSESVANAPKMNCFQFTEPTFQRNCTSWTANGSALLTPSFINVINKEGRRRSQYVARRRRLWPLGVKSQVLSNLVTKIVEYTMVKENIGGAIRSNFDSYEWEHYRTSKELCKGSNRSYYSWLLRFYRILCTSWTRKEINWYVLKRGFHRDRFSLHNINGVKLVRIRQDTYNVVTSMFRHRYDSTYVKYQHS